MSHTPRSASWPSVMWQVTQHQCIYHWRNRHREGQHERTMDGNRSRVAGHPGRGVVHCRGHRWSVGLRPVTVNPTWRGPVTRPLPTKLCEGKITETGYTFWWSTF